MADHSSSALGDLLQHKAFFLKLLHAEPLKKSFLNESQDKELQILLTLFHLIATKQIEIPKSLFETYKVKRKVSRIQKLADHAHFASLLASPRKEHLDVLNGLFSVLKATVECLK